MTLKALTSYEVLASESFLNHWELCRCYSIELTRKIHLPHPHLCPTTSDRSWVTSDLHMELFLQAPLGWKAKNCVQVGEN